MDPFEEIKDTFFQECDEQLAECEAGLQAIKDGEGDDDTVNAVFRAVHSIKGGAGAFGLEDLVRFAHTFESVLDEVRSGKLAPDGDLLNLMLTSSDMLSDHVQAARGGDAVDAARSQSLVEQLDARRSGGGAAPAKSAPGGGPVMTPGVDADGGIEGFDFTPVAIAIDDEGDGEQGAEDGDAGASDADEPPLPDMAALVAEVEAGAVEAGEAESLEAAAPEEAGWVIRFRPKSALYASANEPGVLLRELVRLGEAEVRLDAEAVPALDEMEPEESYLAWTIALKSDATLDEVAEIFEFVEDDCDLEIVPAGEAGAADEATDEVVEDAAPEAGEPAEDAAAPEAGGEEMPDVDALIAMAQAMSEPELAAAAEPDPEPAQAAPADAPAAAAPAPAADKDHPPAAQAKQASGGGSSQPAQTIRVELDRVDRLIDLVGELVINQAMLAQRVYDSGVARNSDVALGLDDLEHLTRDIQESVMAIRAQPVRSVFQRMPRLVRECASMTGKQVRLETEGEGTEVDKTVVERLSEPITHMIRNAIDHGLESTEDRVAAGKSEEGVVTLSARHRSGRIVIEVADDGKGIPRKIVKQKAIEKGLIEPDANLSDEEIDNLIFMPGFSTASAISDLSGRGVGMDVVKRSIQSLGGRIWITSKPGLGSTFTMSLPLTLAVLDGMVVTAAEQTLVTPLAAILETLQPKQSELRRLGPNSWVIAIRDTYVPLVDVGSVLGYRDRPLDPSDGVALLIEAEGGGRAAFLVDAIQGQRQVVIKSLEANYRKVEGIAAATILGDGRVALILDVDAILAKRRHDAPQASVPLAAAV